MTKPIAVLSSGGLDSCILLNDAASASKVFPIYIRQGLVWEKDELKALNNFILSLNNSHIQPITTLHFPIESLYGNHWSVSGIGIPSQFDADNKTYLPGRNVLLLGLAGVWCSLHQVSRIGIGTLQGNPFQDASLDFFNQYSITLSTGLGHHISIEAPFCEKYKKEDLIRAYQTLPLELTLTCMAPRDGNHCGLCNKCKERQAAYRAAGVRDRTIYATK